MRLSQAHVERLATEGEGYTNGWAPDLGTLHPKAGYRFSIGFVADANGQPTKWRENLGKDKFVAINRARAMHQIWAAHVCDTWPGDRNVAPDVPPMDRVKARTAAWNRAAKYLNLRTAIATLCSEVSSAFLRSFPGVKMAVGRQAVAGGVEEVALADPETRSATNLHRAADRRLAHLRHRLENNDISDPHVLRMSGLVKHFKRQVADRPLASIDRAALEEIRLVYQAHKTRKGRLASRETVRTELRGVSTMFVWLNERQLWQALDGWSKALRPVFRSADQDDDEDDDERDHDVYSVEELAKVYGHAGYSLKLWMLCALDFAWGQTEISTAKKKHFKTTAVRPLVSRFRHKRTSGGGQPPKADGEDRTAPQAESERHGQSPVKAHRVSDHFPAVFPNRSLNTI